MVRVTLVAAALLMACDGRAGGLLDGGSDAGRGDGGVVPPDGGEPDAGTTDGGTSDGGASDAGPAHHAGSYATTLLDFPIRAVGVREHSVVYDSFNGGGYVITYADASGPLGFRMQGVNLRTGAAPTVGPELAIDDPLAYEHYSGPNALASGTDATGAQGLLLVAFAGYRQVPVGGAYQNHIYGQFLRAEPDGRLERVGANFVISNGSSNEQKPCVAWDETARNFLVGYSSAREHPIRPDGWVLFVRTVSPSGALGPELRIGENELGQVNCAVCAGGGRALVGWHDYLSSGGNDFNTGYRARFVIGGAVGPVLPVTRVGMIIPDPVAIAYNARQDEWMMATALNRTIRVSIYAADGSTRVVDRVAATPPEGAGVPFIAWSKSTNSYLLTWHAWTSNDAAAVEVDPDGRAAGPLLRLNTVAPPNGTYLTPIGASTRSGEFLVVMMKDFTRLNGTLFQSPEQLP